MREIKFRAWSKFTEKMIHPDETGWYDRVFMGSNGFLQTTDLAGIVNRDDVVAMQYTGLKDKNGREIYEGDIVMQLSERTYDSVTGVVKFIDGRYVIESADGKTSVYLFDEVAFNVLIGNIYETPELLDGEPNAI